MARTGRVQGTGMASIKRVRVLLAAAGFMFAGVAGAAPQEPARTAPAPHCLDARMASEVFQSDARTLAVATAAGGRFRVELGPECPGIATEPGAKLLARNGWMCGAAEEYIAAGEWACPVTAVTPIGPDEYATHARASSTSVDGTVTLSSVVVQGKRRRGFAASASYCLNPRHMRGWSEGPEGLLVEVNPRRSGGYRHYRVELARSCPQLEGGASISLHSGLGIGLVCGNPGDSVLSGTRMGLGGAASRALAQEPLVLGRGGRHPGMMMTATDRLQNLGAKLGCPISAVYPVEL